MFFKLIIFLVGILFAINITINAECNVCGQSGIACISDTQYLNCTDEGIMDELSFNECPVGEYCDENKFCTSTATCDVSSRVLTKAGTATEMCATLRVGRYVVPGTLCTRYVNCYVFNNTLLGVFYTCPGQTFFNNAVGLCTYAPIFICVA